LSKESDQEFNRWYELEYSDSGSNSHMGAMKRCWDSALSWCRPLAIAAIVKAKASKRQKKAPKEPSTFTPPSLDELTAYMRQQGLVNPTETAEAFSSYYETRGWVPSGSRTRMKSWKAAVRTWKIHNFPVNRKNGDSPGEDLSVSPEAKKKRAEADERLLARYREQADRQAGITTGA
jgi:hypothetical protein